MIKGNRNIVVLESLYIDKFKTDVAFQYEFIEGKGTENKCPKDFLYSTENSINIFINFNNEYYCSEKKLFNFFAVYLPIYYTGIFHCAVGKMRRYPWRILLVMGYMLMR
jgi:hypothetical protein